MRAGVWWCGHGFSRTYSAATSPCRMSRSSLVRSAGEAIQGCGVVGVSCQGPLGLPPPAVVSHCPNFPMVETPRTPFADQPALVHLAGSIWLTVLSSTGRGPGREGNRGMLTEHQGGSRKDSGLGGKRPAGEDSGCGAWTWRRFGSAASEHPGLGGGRFVWLARKPRWRGP